MKWSYTLGRLFGTEIKMHTTFLLLVALYSYDGYRRGGPMGALTSGTFLLALFGCVLLHEFGHILMARRYGVRTPDVLLLPIGGVARLERMPDEPRQEFFIAIAGPVVTLAIAVLLYGVLLVIGHAPTQWTWSLTGGDFIAQLMRINVFLLLFNLLPAFPMDGGRVLRALLAARLGLGRATRIAAQVGQGLAILMGLFALAAGRPILVLIALFVFIGAQGEQAAVETRLAGEGLRVGQFMVAPVRSIGLFASLADAVAILLATEQREFPVLDAEGRVAGLLTRDGLIRGLSEQGTAGLVRDAMHADPPLLGPETPFEPALVMLRQSGLAALPVVHEGTLVGLLTLDNVTDLLLVRRALTPA